MANVNSRRPGRVGPKFGKNKSKNVEISPELAHRKSWKKPRKELTGREFWVNALRTLLMEFRRLHPALASGVRKKPQHAPSAPATPTAAAATKSQHTATTASALQSVQAEGEAAQQRLQQQQQQYQVMPESAHTLWLQQQQQQQYLQSQLQVCCSKFGHWPLYKTGFGIFSRLSVFCVLFAKNFFF